MRVAFNANPLTSPQPRGWTRYTVNLLAALPECGVRPILLAREPLNPACLASLPPGSFDVEVAPPMGYARWEQWWIPRRCRATRADLYHCPLNFGVPFLCSVPRILTLHDAIGQAGGGPRRPWREFVSKGYLSSRTYHLIARTRAERIITVSDYSRKDLIEKLGIGQDRVTVVAEAADPAFLRPITESARSAVRATWGLTRPYVFYVGGWEDRKNLPLLLRGFAEANLPDVDLVLAGGRDDQGAALLRLATELGIDDRLRRLGFIPDEDLPAMYASALAFVYPSRYEGFGLQLVEAMSVGCPVLAACATSLPEVLGDGGETFDPSDPRDLADRLGRVARDPGHRDALAGRAMARAAEFSWSRTAAETVEVYRATLA